MTALASPHLSNERALQRNLAWQTVAAVAVLLALVLVEAAAFALWRNPGSPFLWFINRELFGFAELARLSELPVRLSFTSATIYWATGGILVTLLAYRARLRLIVGLVSHFCFILVGQIAYVTIAATHAPRYASLDHSLGTAGQLSLMVVIPSVIVALASVVLCHVSYLTSIVRKNASPGK